MAERSKTIKKYMSQRPDLMDEYEREIENTEAARKVIAAGPYPGIGVGHIDLYKAFAWRNWQLLRDSGALGVVLPRGALNGSGTQKWRREILEHGTFSDVVVTINTGNWVFANVDGRYTTALVVAEKRLGVSHLRFAGPFPSMTEFLAGRGSLVQVEKSEFLTWTGTAAFPLIPDALAGEVFRQMRKSPAFSATEGFEFRPVQGDLNSAANRELFNTNLTAARGEVPVLTGSSFNMWEPDFGDPYAYGNSRMVKHILDKTKNSASQARSAFHGMEIATADDLPMNAPRIAFRDVTNATNTRTMVCCLVPPGVALVHKAPYLVRRAGTEADEAYVLGVLSSRVFDWYTRRLVELAMTFETLMPMPVPRPRANDPLRVRIGSLAGSLAAVDKRYAPWAKSVGVPVGSVKANDREVLEAELDALVAHLYGLTRRQVEHIFKTFHRGWVYAPRLALVLEHFDSIAGTNS